MHDLPLAEAERHPEPAAARARVRVEPREPPPEEGPPLGLHQTADNMAQHSLARREREPTVDALRLPIPSGAGRHCEPKLSKGVGIHGAAAPAT